MKKLFGFTLAEVLVTMGIVGVIAAMTTPVLMANVQRQALASSLKSTVGDLENAFAAAISSEGVDTLDQTSIFTSGTANIHSSAAEKQAIINSLGRYLKLGDVNINEDSWNFYANRGAANPRQMGTNGKPAGQRDIEGNALSIPLKNGAVMFFRTWNAGHAVANVQIDVNGIEGPNVKGRDIFRFFLQDNATLAPFGSQIAHDNGGGALWTATCPRNNNITDGDTCTARLVENNYNFDY